MRKSFFALILGFTLSGGALAQQPPTKSSFKDDPEVAATIALIETRLEADRLAKKIPGMSAAVVYDQEVVWAKGFGYADV